MHTYACVVTADGTSVDAQLAIGRDGIKAMQGGTFELSFADIMDMRLLNYRLNLVLRDRQAQISQLGYRTEDFFEELWAAYAAKSKASLFVDDAPDMCSEGDYAYAEPAGDAHGIAKLEVYGECVCVHPHDVGARRIPLCFADECRREGFSLTLGLDTGERYRLARLGRDTDGFFDRVEASRKKIRARWQRAQATLERELDVRLGDAKGRFDVLCGCGSRAEVGLFSPEDDGFWIVALSPGRAAVELVTSENTATYLYRYTIPDDGFVRSLRHAMEAVRRNRRIIFVDDDEAAKEPLYRMAIDRSAHVRFLRSCCVGRAIHTTGWEDRVTAFFAGD
jgi:hypothetical protein